MKIQLQIPAILEESQRVILDLPGKFTIRCVLAEEQGCDAIQTEKKVNKALFRNQRIFDKMSEFISSRTSLQCQVPNSPEIPSEKLGLISNYHRQLQEVFPPRSTKEELSEATGKKDKKSSEEVF